MSSEPYLGSLLLVPYNFAPRGFAYCSGQLLSIAQNAALFSLLGTTYGGDGRVTFALPDLRGRVPLHLGQGPGLSNYVQGEVGGVEVVTLLQTQLPQHQHTLAASGRQGTTSDPAGNLVAASASPRYAAPADAQLRPDALSIVGGSQPHENRAPTLVLAWVIALQGIFPSRN